MNFTEQHINIWASAFALLLVFSSCEKTQPEVPSAIDGIDREIAYAEDIEDADLTDLNQRSDVYRPPTINALGTWELIAMNNNSILLRPGDVPMIRILGRTIEGFAGCNDFHADLHMNNGFHISDLAATRMYCQATNELEREFLATLRHVNEWNVFEGDLHLESERHSELVFRRVVAQ